MAAIGEQLGNYRLKSLLGRGGFADVFLGEHVYLKTQAAVKVLQTRLSGQEDLESFLKEAQTVAHLIHPNIIRILDFGVDGETPFLVMDYAPNGTLRQRHTRGVPVNLSVIVPYVKQVASALQHAHDEKLIHRDVKPENILVGRKNEIVLSDFGIALIAQSSRYQSTQDVIGTVAYMSPEQIQGRPRPASDQYSLGIVVYEWLSGERPFNGSFTELCTQHMFATVPSLRAKNPAISPEVEQVINIALTKDPKQRFGSVLAFATALEQAGQGISTQFAPPPPVQPPLLPTDPALPPAPDLYGTQQQMIYTTPPTPIPAPRLKSGWGLYKAQWIAMVIGILIYGVAEFLMDMLTIHFPYTFFYPIGGISFLPSLVLLFYGISLVIPLFFGARYGPWVGLIVAFVGALAGDWLANVSGQNILFWPWDLAWLPLGFIAGLAYVKTRGQYNRRGLVGFGVFMGTVAILANAIGVAIATGISVTFWVNLVSYFLGNLPGVLFLFIALLISGSITRRRRAFRY